MHRRPETIAALLNGLIVWLLPTTISALFAIGRGLGIGASDTAITVHPPGWSPLDPIMGTALQFGFVMLPFAALAAWRTWVHARRWRERGGSGWQGVGEAGACGLATLLVVLAPRILSHLNQVTPTIFGYGGLATLMGLLIGLLLRTSAVIVLKLTEPTSDPNARNVGGFGISSRWTSITA
jgi:hypothetical protein